MISAASEAGLKPLRVNDTVRVLLMTRKEQAVPGKVKGFAPKWSVRMFTVLRRAGLRRNPGVFRYDVGLDMTFYRQSF